MKKTSKAALVLAMAMFAGSAAARSTEIYEPPQILWGASVVQTEQQMRDRLAAAGQSLGWLVTKDEPGRLVLHYDKQGKHQVDIAIRYDQAGYKIEYLNSVNLNFSQSDDVRKIHPNYNRWIRYLIEKIEGK